MTITGNFEHFLFFYFGINFLKNANPFETTGVLFFVEKTKIGNVTFPNQTGLSETNECSDVLNERVENGPITKNGVLPVTTSFFQKFCFSLRKNLV